MSRWLRGVASPLPLLLVAGCGPSQMPWRDAGGRDLGTVSVETLDDGGSEKRFVDRSGQVQRIERRAPPNDCATGVCTIVWEYGSIARFAPAAGAEAGAGDAVREWRGDGYTCAFFGADGTSVSRADGARRLAVAWSVDRHIERVDYIGDGETLLRVRAHRYRNGQLSEVSFGMPDGRPAEGRFRGETVATVRYDYVQGVNDIDVVVEHYLGPSDTTLKTVFHRQPIVPEDPCR